MRRLMTLVLPIFMALWVAVGVAAVFTESGSTSSTVLTWLLLPFAWFAMVPVAGFIGGIVGFEPRNMNQLYGSGWSAGMRAMRRPGRWHHTG